MADKYSAETISSREAVKPPTPPAAGKGPSCADAELWTPSNDPQECTMTEIQKGFGLK